MRKEKNVCTYWYFVLERNRVYKIPNLPPPQKNFSSALLNISFEKCIYQSSPYLLNNDLTRIWIVEWLVTEKELTDQNKCIPDLTRLF